MVAQTRPHLALVGLNVGPGYALRPTSATCLV